MSEVLLDQAPPSTRVAEAIERDRVQVMRGLACLLLVLFHVIGGNAHDGLRVSDDGWIRKGLDLLLYIRMPIFGFLSGYVYALRPTERGRLLPFLKGKARRLLLPLATASTLFFLTWNALDGALVRRLPDIWRIYVFSYEIFWFLQAIALIFVGIAVLEGLGLLRRPAGVVVAAVVAYLLATQFETVTFLSIGGALYLAPYFLLGLAARRFKPMEAAGFPRAVVVIQICAFALHAWKVLTLPHAESVGRVHLLSPLVGGGASLLLLRYLPSDGPGSGWLARIGDSSFAIFLFHIFFAAGSRLVLTKLGVTDLAILVAVGMALAIAGPMALEALLKRHAVTRRVFLGLNLSGASELGDDSGP